MIEMLALGEPEVQDAIISGLATVIAATMGSFAGEGEILR